MAIARAVTNNTANGGATTAGSITKPTGWAAGNLGVLFGFLQATTPGLSAGPTGWTLIPGPTFPISGSGNTRLWAWYRFLQAGDADPSWTWSGTSPAWGSVLDCYSGVDTGTTFGATSGVGSAASGTSATVNAVTTTQANSYVLNGVGIGSASATFTVTPTGYTVWPVQNASNKRTAGAYQAMGASGSSSGATAWTISASNPWATLTVELLEAVTATTKPPKPVVVNQAISRSYNW